MELAQTMENLTDEELLRSYKNGDERALGIIIARYEKVVKKISYSFYLIRWEREDILQEGMIALIKAINKYNPDQDPNTFFYPFAKKVIHLHMIGILRKHTRLKHQILNLAIPLENNGGDYDNDNTGIIEYYPSPEADNPIDLLVKKENMEEVSAYIKLNFSYLECRVLVLYLENRPYKDIARIIGVSLKSVDNAMTRVKKKLKKTFLDNDEYRITLT